MTKFRSKLFDVLFGLWTVVLGLCTPAFWVLGTPQRIRAFSRLWSGGTIFGLKHVVGLTHRETGLEHKHAPGPVIFACNHQSSWETLIFNVLVPDIAVVLKQSLYSYPIMGWYLKRSPMIAVDRDAGTGAMRQLLGGAKTALAEGRSIMIFPEGTRQDVDVDLEYNRGVALLYKQLKLPVVPVAMNSGLFWSKNGFSKKAGEITVSYMPPIPAGLGADEFMQQLQSAITEEKQKLAALK
ncbi:MAG: 1-acyl-sn-glycerol-3-phosphate acyltransferase [Alphaproteobacteria bacterium]|nr:1-acyl-sn-glycerol-3-phosphate acyltransferase [Alphaproteobacteria bacterium]